MVHIHYTEKVPDLPPVTAGVQIVEESGDTASVELPAVERLAEQRQYVFVPTPGNISANERDRETQRSIHYYCADQVLHLRAILARR